MEARLLLKAYNSLPTSTSRITPPPRAVRNEAIKTPKISNLLDTAIKKPLREKEIIPIISATSISVNFDQLWQYLAYLSKH